MVFSSLRENRRIQTIGGFEMAKQKRPKTIKFRASNTDPNAPIVSQQKFSRARKPTKKQAAETKAKNREATANRMKSNTDNPALNQINRQTKKANTRNARAKAQDLAGTVDRKTGVTRSKTIGANSSKTKSAYTAQTSGKGKTDAVRTRTGESRAFTNTKSGMVKAGAYLGLANENLTPAERSKLEKKLKNGGG
jgi:hypothetical protein